MAMVLRKCGMNFLRSQLNLLKRFSHPVSCAENAGDNGLIIGVYKDPENEDSVLKLTSTGEKYNRMTCGRLMQLLKISGPPPKLGESRIFYNIEPTFEMVTVVGLGKECSGYDILEKMDEGKENIRVAASVGAQAIQNHNKRTVFVESFGHSESAAEGAALGIWAFQDNKAKHKRLRIPFLELHDDCDYTGWQIGLQKAAAQNLARQLADTPANLMTPTLFAQTAVEILTKSGINVEVKVRGWAETQNMNAFLQVTKGSCEPPIFLEISYYGTGKEERPILLVGKGVTFNSGGLCIKSPKGQKYMRGDMTGAACVVATTRAVANLELPLNIRGLIPLTENMPGCSAMRPGDIVTAMNGKSIKLDHTDNAGRMMMADALTYAATFWPRFILDIGSMTKDMSKGLGCAACGVWSNSESLWRYMEAASMHTGDRVWRFPLWNHFTHLITHNHNVDLKSKGRGKSSNNKVAAFLNEFVPCGEWIHMDCYNTVVSNGTDFPYLREGMSGRPTRTLVEFLSQMVCQREC